MSSRNNNVGMNLPGNQGLDGLTGGRTSLFRHEQQAIDEIKLFYHQVQYREISI